MEKNVLLTISYDGSGFSGWQKQPDQVTVQGYLETVLSSVFHTQVVLNGTSRTDAGVHALGQRASFQADIKLPVERIPLVVNNVLAGREKGSYAIAPIRIVSAEEMPPAFHARFDAKGKKYIYRINNTGVVDLFRRHYVYHVDRPLNVSAMKDAAAYLKGTHDFKSFESAGGNPRKTTVRTIFDIEVLAQKQLLGESAGNRSARVRVQNGSAEVLAGVMPSDASMQPSLFCASAGNPLDTAVEGHAGERGFAGGVEIHISGDGFLYNMVRIITGTLVDIGLGKKAAGDMKHILACRDRSAAGHTAPPYGLYLAEVYYREQSK